LIKEGVQTLWALGSDANNKFMLEYIKNVTKGLCDPILILKFIVLV